MLMFSYLMATGITTGAFYALVALGIVIVYKSTEAVNLAHGELFMVGGMLAYTCYVMAGIPYLRPHPGGRQCLSSAYLPSALPTAQS